MVYIKGNNWYLIRMSNMATTAGPGAHLSLWSKSESQATLTAVRGGLSTVYETIIGDCRLANIHCGRNDQDLLLGLRLDLSPITVTLVGIVEDTGRL